VSISVGKSTVVKAAAGGPGLCPGDKTAREVDARSADLGVLLRESTGIESGATAQFEDVSTGSWTAGRKKSAGNLLGVVAKEILATESVEPGTAFEEAIGWTP
jgi:hypothetical protein